jgi:hypothetical protein
MRCGHSALATCPAIPERQPYFRASYCRSYEGMMSGGQRTDRRERTGLTDAVVKTPPPTPNALPFNDGSRLTSTFAYLFRKSARQESVHQVEPTHQATLTNASMSTCTICCERSRVASSSLICGIQVSENGYVSMRSWVADQSVRVVLQLLEVGCL